MKYRGILVVLLLLAYFVPDAGAIEPEVRSIEPPANILFVGNSYTYYNNSLHNMLRLLVRSSELDETLDGRYRAMTLSGGRQAEHAPAMPALIGSEDWDVVILQGHSREAIDPEAVDSFRDAVRNYDRLLDNAGIQTLLFMTWAPADRPELTTPIANSYTSLGNQVGALVVPVGLAFAEVVRTHPDIVLHMSDNSHPTFAGSYLAGCVFFAAMFGQSPEGLDFPQGTPTLDAGTARRLQQAAWTTVRSFYGD